MVHSSAILEESLTKGLSAMGWAGSRKPQGSRHLVIVVSVNTHKPERARGLLEFRNKEAVWRGTVYRKHKSVQEYSQCTADYKERGGAMNAQAPGFLPPSNPCPRFHWPNQPRARGWGSLLKLSNGQDTEQHRKSWRVALKKETNRPNMNLKKNHHVTKFLQSHKKRQRKVY